VKRALLRRELSHAREAAEEARLSLMDKTAGCCYFFCSAASPCSGLFLSKSSPTRLLIGKGSLPGVAPLGRPAIQPAWTLLEGSDRKDSILQTHRA
jgi:hypothetical protein